jgi:hypothetical protein
MNTSTHPLAPEEVMAFLDGELPAAHAQSISDHLKQCADCSTLAAQLGQIKSQLAGWQVESLPPAAEAKIQEAAGKRLSRPHGFSQILFQKIPSVLRLRPILALCVVILAALLLTRSGRSPRDSVFEHYILSSPSPLVQTSKSIPQNATAPEDYSAALAAKPLARTSHSLAVSALTIKGSRSESSSAEAFSTGNESSEDDSPTPAAPIHQPMIARNVSLTIITKDFASSRASLEAILARHHGYSAQLTASTSENAPRSITASLRVPANELASTLAELKTLGHVETESQSGEEVTQQHADLIARLKNSRETEQRLQDVLRTRTGKVKDVLEVEEEIARVRGEIEQMEAAQKALEHRVDFSTIDLKLAEEYKAQLTSPAPSVGMQLRNASINGFRSASESVLGIVLFFAESGPTFLLWLALLLLPGRMLWRRYRRAHALVSPLGV